MKDRNNEIYAQIDRITDHLVAMPKQEYCDDTVNFRSTTKSFKNKKKIERPPEEWQIFRDTHPAIIDREIFLLLLLSQKL